MKCVSLSLAMLLLVASVVSAQEQEHQVSVQSLYMQGHQLYTQNKFKEAIEQFDKALAKDSTYLLAWCYKGMVLNRLARCSEAISAFDSALRLDKDCIYAFAGKAETLEKLEEKRTQKCYSSKRFVFNQKRKMHSLILVVGTLTGC